MYWTKLVSNIPVYWLVVLVLVVDRGHAFPSGASVEACDSLLPRHIRTSPKPPEESPFIFYASSKRYYPDAKRRKIKVHIKGHPFRGFLVVAIDGESHQRIGTFIDSVGMESLPCAGVTHTDARKKIAAAMIWKPPENRKSGEVFFLATILESFSSYYSQLIASIPSKKKKKKKKQKKHSVFKKNWNQTISEILL